MARKATATTAANVGYEAQLWQMADALRNSNWRGELLKDDPRWAYGTPPAGSANYAWVQHFIHHLAPTGLAGYRAFAEIPVAVNRGFIATIPKMGTSNLFLLLWASVAHVVIISRDIGSTFLEISKTNILPIPIVSPSPDVMHRFDEVARALYGRIVDCARESRALVVLRDMLLPRLMSGDLRIGDVEPSIPAVAG